MNLFESIKTGNLIGKYLAGKETKEEQIQLQTWINESDDHRKLFNSLKKEGNIADSIDEFETFNREQAWRRYTERVHALSLQKLLSRWRIAAVFFFLVGCAGILAYLNKEGAALMANTYTTVATSNGQSSKIFLPDSTVVWINSGTKLSYNTSFAVDKRAVKLTGQAFFQVARNEQLPLTVTCNDLEIRVLGTSFDISAYPEDKNISVVLESGSIQLQKADDHSLIQKMQPGEMAEFNTNHRKLSISKVDCNNYTSWKNGILIFKDQPMEKVLEKLERWYNIDIEVKSNKVNQLIFNATIINESVEEIFDLMKFSCAISYSIIPSRSPDIPVKVIISK
jgi:ferric-dicitrate binding protein FerR (iron transport regulator)